jgi:hypothetical protein
MEILSDEEKFILKMIKEHGEMGQTLHYRKLQEYCADKFEGVRLILKKMKEKGLVDYSGMIPDFSAIISLQYE